MQCLSSKNRDSLQNIHIWRTLYERAYQFFADEQVIGGDGKGGHQCTDLAQYADRGERTYAVTPCRKRGCRNEASGDPRKLAGGARDGCRGKADTSVLNLSKKLIDEMVIIVYSKEQVSNFVAVKDEEKQKIELCQSQND